MTVKGGTTQACAACKYQRRKCSSECTLAPYFPATQPNTFRNAHRLFGVCNMMKILKPLNSKEMRDEAMKSIIYESDMRQRFPVHGCCEVICHLRYQLVQAMQELQHVQSQLDVCKRGEYCHGQIYDDVGSYSPELELGMNPVNSSAFVVPAPVHYAGDNSVVPPFHQVVASGLDYGDDHDHVTKQFNRVEDDPVPPVNSKIDALHGFPIQHETAEIDYDDELFDTLADDQQSFVESKEGNESCCESPWKLTTQSVEDMSKNELKNAAACFRLTSVN